MGAPFFSVYHPCIRAWGLNGEVTPWTWPGFSFCNIALGQMRNAHGLPLLQGCCSPWLQLTRQWVPPSWSYAPKVDLPSQWAGCLGTEIALCSSSDRHSYSFYRFIWFSWISNSRKFICSISLQQLPDTFNGWGFLKQINTISLCCFVWECTCKTSHATISKIVLFSGEFETILLLILSLSSYPFLSFFIKLIEVTLINKIIDLKYTIL